MRRVMLALAVLAALGGGLAALGVLSLPPAHAGACDGGGCN